MQKRREIEERTLDSSNRSLGLLYESERAGAATAEELNRQKEQLKRTEERLDDINSTLKTSERHLQVLTNTLLHLMSGNFPKILHSLMIDIIEIYLILY